MKPSSLHHHHNDLMTTTPPSELKIQGIVSSQTQRQAELTSRSSQCLLQWSSVAGSIFNSCRSQQPSLTGKGIELIHLCKGVELTSSSRFILKSESSEHNINLSEGDVSGISSETSVDSHQEGRSSLTMVIRHQGRVEFHCRAEEHQSVIVLDHIFIANPHHLLQTTSEQPRHDIARRVSSDIRQPESSSRDPNHQRVIPLSVIRESINDHHHDKRRTS